jgi:RNA polymerase sigma-70 factor, ECF subfamily
LARVLVISVLRYLAHVIGSPGDWLMTPALATGQPAAAAYYRDDGGTHRGCCMTSIGDVIRGIRALRGPGPGGRGLRGADWTSVATTSSERHPRT